MLNFPGQFATLAASAPQSPLQWKRELFQSGFLRGPISKNQSFSRIQSYPMFIGTQSLRQSRLFLSKFLPLSLIFVHTKTHSTYTFNSTIRSHLSAGRFDKALTHFTHFREDGLLPDRFSIPSLLKLCFRLNQPILHGENIHGYVIKNGYLQDVFIGTGIIEMYFKYGYFAATHVLFDESSQRDVVLWTALITGFSQNGNLNEALNFLSRMIREGMAPNQITISSFLSACSKLKVLNLGRVVHGFSIRNGIIKEDVVLKTAFLHMYVNCSGLGYASRLFDRMKERSSVSWNAMITGYANNGSTEVVLRLFKEMMWDGKQPVSSTLASVLQVCGETTDLGHGREIHGHIVRGCGSDSLDILVENNALIDMYVKSGDIDSAILLFKSVPNKSLVSWTTMIMGYGMHGLSKEALKTFDEMKESGIRPDGITYISLLSACSHGKLVDEGEQLYVSMQKNYNIEPEMRHFACMVDLYGRAGLLEKAYDFIERMPVEPSEFIWAALLSSCRAHKNIDLGEKAAKAALALNQYNAGVYILLSRMYADSERWEDLSNMRLTMKKLGVKPVVACSWVEVERKLYTFTVGDNMNSSAEKIYDFLDTLQRRMEKAGLQPKRSVGGHNIGEEEKKGDLCGHTERLALAFVLIKCGDKGGPIRIGKNLRVCKDCHETFKYISKEIDREITLKDPNRYHKFRQGHCSCCDFW